MAKAVYFGVSGKARKVKAVYFGVGGKARKVKKAYIGVGGKARLFYSSLTEKSETFPSSGATSISSSGSVTEVKLFSLTEEQIKNAYAIKVVGNWSISADYYGVIASDSFDESISLEDSDDVVPIWSNSIMTKDSYIIGDDYTYIAYKKSTGNFLTHAPYSTAGGSFYFEIISFTIYYLGE